ncbi:MAG TPA: inorganic phosphate transporter [Methanoregulaceae archaeon]|nr:inorganic phosphate transporter [Methanoregulaceae archaeon]HPD76016.1 inorganic phosphate transporter [Methanoregulaceae archaeon]HRY75535.1 inorganic phosphate transporter [Methanoregulaceae archaeon]
MEPLILFGIILALALNFVNGLNDASHSIATVVATRALSPLKATLLTGICNLLGPFVFTTAVAYTIGTEIIRPGSLSPLAIVVAMMVSIALVFVATRSGLPISSSHALVGAILGAGIAASGLQAVVLPSVSSVETVIAGGMAGAVTGFAVLFLVTGLLNGDRTLGGIIGAVWGIAFAIPLLMITGLLHLSGILAIVLFIFISPVLGGATAFLFDILVSHAFRHSRQNRMKRIFQPLHVAASLVQATGHGANDGQHAVGIITALLLSAGMLAAFEVPAWVVLASAIAIGLGTCFGGWQVVDKMAKEITRIRPYQGFCAATTGSGVLSLVTLYGIPVSSTHVISGAIVGVGATRGKNAVRWDVVREMMTAWVVTIPISLACAFAGYLVAALILPALA